MEEEEKVIHSIAFHDFVTTFLRPTNRNGLSIHEIRKNYTAWLEVSIFFFLGGKYPQLFYFLFILNGYLS